jgi:rubredoxin
VYRCELCLASVAPRTPAIRVVLESRPRSYPFRRDAHAYRDKRSGTLKVKDDPGGTGWEIAREALICPACAAARASSPEPRPHATRAPRPRRAFPGDDESPGS